MAGTCITRGMLSSSQRLLILLIAVIASTTLQLVEGTITVVKTGKSYESRPDKNWGETLLHGYNYVGRLQYIHDNPTLCQQGTGRTVIAPPDGVPVVLYAKAGGCSVYEKALMASKYLTPAHTVAYIIVDDEGQRDSEEMEADHYTIETDPFSSDENSKVAASPSSQRWDSLWSANPLLPTNEEDGIVTATAGEMMELAPWMMDVELEAEEDDNMNEDDESILTSLSAEELLVLSEVSDDESTPIILTDTNNNSVDQDSAQLRALRKKHPSKKDKKNDNSELHVAILHVNAKVGYRLLETIYNEDASSRADGGLKLLLDNRGSAASAKSIILWTLFSILLSAVVCCCLLLCVHAEDDEPTAPTRPVRRRLTHQQVRANFPAFHYSPDQCHEIVEDEECPICLDEYEDGARCRKLPCNHVFHSACIGRWLIERNAFCPLCKFDVYEEDEDEVEAAVQGTITQPLISENRTLSFWERLSLTVHQQTEESLARANGAAGSPTPPAAPPMTMFRRLQSRNNLSRGDAPTEIVGAVNNNANAALSQESWWTRTSNWFATNTRTTNRSQLRPTPGDNGLVTELTEPLLLTASNEEEEGAAVLETAAASPASGGADAASLASSFESISAAETTTNNNRAEV